MAVRTIACRCGSVAVELRGDPIFAAICYCDDCQAAGHRLEALPDAPPVLGPDGGTPYVLHRRDRVRVVKGADRLTPMKLHDGSPTSRMVASCCNTPMFVGFDRGPFWASLYRDRYGADAPPIEMRVQTRFKPQGVTLPSDLPASRGMPLRAVGRLLAAYAGMLLARPRTGR